MGICFAGAAHMSTLSTTRLALVKLPISQIQSKVSIESIS
jgi:hypothetical protein